jgi:hypothetical protein
VISDLIDHPRSPSRGNGSTGVSIDNLSRSLFDSALVRADTVTTWSGDTAEIAEFSLATTARSGQHVVEGMQERDGDEGPNIRHVIFSTSELSGFEIHANA